MSKLTRKSSDSKVKKVGLVASSSVSAAGSNGYGTGRRKCSVARVWVKYGTGKYTVNGKSLFEYFPREVLSNLALKPFATLDVASKFDVFSTVCGGGHSGQAGALSLGIARALLLVDAENRPPLRKAGLLTRDSRVVERKKYGKHKARKSTQFSKR